MKYIKIIILALSLSSLFTGCSYISDMAEAELTTRASFSADAEYDSINDEVIITWDEKDSGDSFAGVEIYRTSEPNKEFVDYELVASRYYTIYLIGINNLDDGSVTTCRVDPPAVPGTYFYRVGLIHMEKDDNTDNPYPVNPGNYDLYSFIDEISGYAKVVIP